MKVAIVYWSGTGNTQAMADLVTEAVKEKGADVDELEASAFGPEAVAGYDAIAFGCPAMGDEVLEEDEMEPFFTALEGKISGKKVVLFGSYDWGDGQWMRDWAERTKKAGAVLAADPLIVNLSPDADGKAKCRELGKALADA